MSWANDDFLQHGIHLEADGFSVSINLACEVKSLSHP